MISSRQGSCAITASAWKRWKRRSRRLNIPTFRQCRSSSTSSASDPSDLFFTEAITPQGWDFGASAACQRFADRQTDGQVQPLKPTITGHSIGMGNRLTGARPSQVWIMKRVCKLLRNCVRLCPAGWSMTQFALRWILMFDAVTCAIPGAKNPSQAEDNAKAADLPPLDAAAMGKVRSIYDAHIKGLVHQYW